nr:MAG TPA: hypothetical protein [Herelleviridae sp.]
MKNAVLHLSTAQRYKNFLVYQIFNKLFHKNFTFPIFGCFFRFAENLSDYCQKLPIFGKIYPKWKIETDQTLILPSLANRNLSNFNSNQFLDYFPMSYIYPV